MSEQGNKQAGERSNSSAAEEGRGGRGESSTQRRGRAPVSGRGSREGGEEEAETGGEEQAAEEEEADEDNTQGVGRRAGEEHGLQTPPDFKVLGSPKKVDKPLVWVLGGCRDRFLEQ